MFSDAAIASYAHGTEARRRQNQCVPSIVVKVAECVRDDRISPKRLWGASNNFYHEGRGS